MTFWKQTATVFTGTAFALTLGAQDANASWLDDLFNWDNGEPGYTETQHPIVLVHGLSGFDNLFGIVDYFNGIPGALAEDGAEVYVPQVSAANSTTVRGEQLLDQVQTIVATTDADKVNLIGHSHGGPTVRYVAGVAPDLVASATSVSGVNWGTPVADAAASGELDALGDIVFSIVDSASGGDLPQDTGAAIESLSTAGSVAFNQDFPAGVPSEYCGNDGASQVNGVHYYSWGGDVIKTNLLDASDSLLAATGTLIDEPNDGLVPACSMKLGNVIGLGYDLNHLDTVNHLFGITSAHAADPVQLYRQQANRLQQAGL
ncbi:esterase/lipase family protein [Halomonadaceae bacterium KBTZ08]